MPTQQHCTTMPARTRTPDVNGSDDKAEPAEIPNESGDESDYEYVYEDDDDCHISGFLVPDPHPIPESSTSTSSATAKQHRVPQDADADDADAGAALTESTTTVANDVESGTTATSTAK